MAWISVTAFSIPKGRSQPVLIPYQLQADVVALRVRQTTRKAWRKAGDLSQQFNGGFVSASQFVEFDKQQVFEMAAIGDYYLKFAPVDYHLGLFVEVWRWLSGWILTEGVWDDAASFDDLAVWRDYP